MFQVRTVSFREGRCLGWWFLTSHFGFPGMVDIYGEILMQNCIATEGPWLIKKSAERSWFFVKDVTWLWVCFVFWITTIYFELNKDYEYITIYIWICCSQTVFWNVTRVSKESFLFTWNDLSAPGLQAFNTSRTETCWHGLLTKVFLSTFCKLLQFSDGNPTRIFRIFQSTSVSAIFFKDFSWWDLL